MDNTCKFACEVPQMTEKGTMDPGMLYESPFIDIAPTGPEQVFGEHHVVRLVKATRAINESAVAMRHRQSG